MKIIKLRKLSEMEYFDISCLFVMKQRWRDRQKFSMDIPRRQNAFLWFCGAEGTFTQNECEPIKVSRGALVLIPQDSRYSIEFSSCDSDPSTILIEFCLNDGEPFAISHDIRIIEDKLDDNSIIDAILKLTAEFAMPSKPWLEIKSNFYRLLSRLALREDVRHIGKRGFSTIEKGIRYLQTNEDQSLYLDEVAAMCYVTPAYFRRMFKAYMGMSPSEYRSRRRIERAKELLINSHLSIAEISDLLGFESPSYFCVAFKKLEGVSPSAYQKNFISIEK